jgi:MFS family permease
VCGHLLHLSTLTKGCSFDQVSWIITGYFLTQVGLILLAGQLLTVLKAKWVLLSAIFFFELGSLLCAVAQNMNVLIFARAVQGIGAYIMI